MKRMRFWWIDDDPTRLSFKPLIEQKLGVDLTFVDVRREELLSKLEDIVDEYRDRHRAPDLVIIDHVLDKTLDDLIREGVVVADLVRREWPECPIIGVSAGVGNLRASISQQISSYEDLYAIDHFSSRITSIGVVAKTFRALRIRRPRGQEDLVSLLKGPMEEAKRIDSILPDDLKEKTKYSDRSLLQRISRWVRHVFLAKPGFVCDELWASTLVGIRNSGFEKIAPILKPSKYAGVFADDTNPVWWKATIQQILFKRYSGKSDRLPWEIGRRLPGVMPEDYSVCHVCGKEFPEIVGYTDESTNTRVQLHIRCSVPHPAFEKALYYEEIRMARVV